jgi:tRNA 2-thiouridine synthesizing protein E
MQEYSNTPQSMDEVLHPGADVAYQVPDFPSAPKGWSKSHAEEKAAEEGLAFSDDHWEAIRLLQEYFARHANGRINPRELHDALDEKFHTRGGLRYLYEMFPGGPIAQGCRMAGLKAPAGSTDTGFGHAV